MPDAVWAQIAAVQGEGGKGSLDAALAKARQAKQACLALLKESKETLDAEERDDRNKRATYPGRWQRQPSAAANVQFRDEYDRFVRAVAQATPQDAKTAKRLSEDGENIALLAQSKAQFAAMMPARAAGGASVGLRENRELGALVQELGQELILGRKAILDAATAQVSVLLFTVTFYANHAHNLTRSPLTSLTISHRSSLRSTRRRPSCAKACGRARTAATS